jgi:hypothetical protein
LKSYFKLRRFGFCKSRSSRFTNCPEELQPYIWELHPRIWELQPHIMELPPQIWGYMKIKLNSTQLKLELGLILAIETLVLPRAAKQK